jgi:tetratricopeptide (TPR) repeat protein
VRAYFYQNARYVVCVLAILSSSMGWAQEIGEKLPVNVTNARVFFLKHEYLKAILAINGEAKTHGAQWIMAESLFRLGEYKKAEVYFEMLLHTIKDTTEREKIVFRLFDIMIINNDIKKAFDRFKEFQGAFKKVPERMAYAMGKAFYDSGDRYHSKEILLLIPQGNEFFIRAQYIIGAMVLNKQNFQESLDIFNKIEHTVPVSVEDYAVRDLAILAQARIFAENNLEDMAEKAYGRVPLKGSFAETATIELIRMMIYQRDRARLSLDRFKNISLIQRESIERASLDTAIRVLDRFRKEHEINQQHPEILSLMASLMLETKRYADARVAYDKLIEHYRPIRHMLNTINDAQNEIWPYFAIDYRQQLGTTHRMSLVAGMPSSLLRGLSEIKEIISLRDRIEESGKKLELLEEASTLEAAKNNLNLEQVRAKQHTIENAYRVMVISKQSDLKQKVSHIIDNFLAEAEFKRAFLVVAEMRDKKEQLKVIRDFQSNNIAVLEKRFKELSKGGSQ